MVSLTAISTAGTSRRLKRKMRCGQRAWHELKKIDHAVVDYDAKGDISCGIGDNVQVISSHDATASYGQRQNDRVQV
jgi:hypothetical protein